MHTVTVCSGGMVGAGVLEDGDLVAGVLVGHGWVLVLGTGILSGLTLGGGRDRYTDMAIMDIRAAPFIVTLILDIALQMTIQIHHHRQTFKTIKRIRTIKAP